MITIENDCCYVLRIKPNIESHLVLVLLESRDCGPGQRDDADDEQRSIVDDFKENESLNVSILK